MYNDAEALERCLTKLDTMGIRALVVDGRFTDFPQINNVDYSTDDVIETASDHNAHYIRHPVSREQDKFNFALQNAWAFDYKVFMYCGADAYFEADMPEFMLSLQRYYEQYAVEPTLVMVKTVETQPASKWNNTGNKQPRLIINYWKMESRYLHWAMFAKGAPDITPLEFAAEVIDGLTLYHDNSIRPKERDDMMTRYQDVNVPRERIMWHKHLVPLAYEFVRILVWKIGIDGTYEQGRDAYFKNYKEFSHLIVVSEGTSITESQVKQFEDVLKKRNKTLDAIPILSGVWKSKTKPENFTLNPEGNIPLDFPKFHKVQQMYSPDGLTNNEEPILVAPYTAGPVVCMNQFAVSQMEHMGDNLDFHSILTGIGFQVLIDRRIQF